MFYAVDSIHSIYTIILPHNSQKYTYSFMNQSENQQIKNALLNFFPRIIREFEEKDEPLFYGGQA